MSPVIQTRIPIENDDTEDVDDTLMASIKPVNRLVDLKTTDWLDWSRGSA